MLNGTELHGQEIEDLRKRAGLSQEALAAAVKTQVGVAIAQSTISRIERDEHETVWSVHASSAGSVPTAHR